MLGGRGVISILVRHTHMSSHCGSMLKTAQAAAARASGAEYKSAGPIGMHLGLLAHATTSYAAMTTVLFSVQFSSVHEYVYSSSESPSYL